MHYYPEKKISTFKIPDYEMLRLIGRGSFGDVWIGRNITGALRAVKVVWRGRFNHAESYEREFRGLQRFAKISLECARQLALLHVGRNDKEGFFYSVMELADDVEGGRQIQPDHYIPLTLRELGLRRGYLPVSEVIRIGVDLAGALVELHQAGLIHRDIKPANIILVGGVPKLADIGMVALEGEAPTLHVGTEGYVPPEGPGTPRADIFATGKVLYELATGLDRTMYPRLPENLGSRDDHKGFFELNEVFDKACSIDPKSRYISSRELLDDLALLQAGKSVLRLRSLERWRHRVRRITGGSFLLICMGILVYHRVERNEWERLQKRERLADSFRQQGISRVNEGDPIGGLPRLLRAADIHERAGMPAEDDWQMALLALRQAPLLEHLTRYPSHINDLRFSPNSRVVAVALEGGEVDLRELGTWNSLGAVNPAELLASTNIRKQACQQVRFLPGGQGMLCLGDSGDVFVWDVDRPAATIRRLPLPTDITALALSADGLRIATSSPGGTNAVWELSDLSRPVFMLPKSEAFALAFSPDGRFVALGGRESTVQLVHVGAESGEPIVVRHRNWVYDLAFSPDGRNLATASADQDVSIWNVADGELLWNLPHDAMVTGVRYDADGRHLLTVSRDKAVRSWNTTSFRSRYRVLPHGETAYASDASADGRWIAAGGGAGVLRLWNLGITSAPPEPDLWMPHFLAGRWLATARKDADVLIPPRSLEGVPARKISWSNLNAYTGSDVGRGSIGCYEDGESSIVLWLAPDGRVSQSNLPSRCQRVLNLNEKNGWLLYEDSGGQLILWSEFRQAALLRRQGEKCLGSKADPHGRWLTLEMPGYVEIFDAVSGKSCGDALPRKMDKDQYFVTVSAFSPDGRFLVVGGSTLGAVPCACLVYRLDRIEGLGRLSAPLPVSLAHEDGIRDLAFSGDGRVLVSVGEDRLARAWETREWKQQGVVMRHSGEVRMAVVSEDGTRLLTASQSRLGQTDTLCLWDLSTCQPLSNHYNVGSKISAIGYLPEHDSWVFGRADPAAMARFAGEIFRRPLSTREVRRVRDTATATMGFEIDELGVVSVIPTILQQDKFEVINGNRTPSTVVSEEHSR